MKVCYSLCEERGPGYDHETNDCSVLAFQNVLGISYEQAHRFCDILGRRDKQGMKLGSIMWDLVAKRIPVFGYSVRDVKTLTVVSQRRAFPGLRRFSLREHMHLLQQGRYMVVLQTHVTVVVDGIIIDSWQVPATLRVWSIWHFQKLNCSHIPFWGFAGA